MSIKCPKCHFDNPADSKFCKGCGTQFLPVEGISVFPTKTLQIPVRELKIGILFADRYQILEELGKGGMGRVYKALDKEINEEVSIKLLKPEIAEDENTIDRFRNELKFARKVSHKNVCRMFHLSKEEETPYITMEYVEGEDLKSLVRKKEKIAEEEAVKIAKQVCEGLAEAHRLGVIHRDLKPQNVMIDKEGNAKIMDFGIARSIEAPGVTATGMMIGTPDYISPEQAEGEEADERSDIYSLGVILYEMVTGRVPFKGETAFSVALKHKSQLPQDPRKINPEVSEDFSRLILICMEKERERRYQTAEDLLADLRSIEEGLPLGTKIRPRRETFATALIRKKLFIPALAVSLVIIGIAVWQVFRPKEAVPVPSGKPSVAIMYFKNNTGDQSLDHWRTALSDLMITDLSQSKYISILPGDRLFKILSQLNQLEAKSYSSDILKQVASRGKVNHIITGDYVKAGDILRISLMLQEAETGELIGSEMVEGQGEESIFSMTDELTRRIKVNFRLSEEEIANDFDKSIGEITTSSPEAYKHLNEGMKLYLKGEVHQCIQFLMKAVAIDADFARAYAWLAMAHQEIRDFEGMTKYIQKAYELRDRVSERERLSIQARFLDMSGKTREAMEEWKKILDLYPEDGEANVNLAVRYCRLEQWDKAIERFQVVIQNQTENVYNYCNQAWAYNARGQYEKGREILEYYLNNISDNATIRTDLALTYLFQGKYDRALVEIDKAFLLNPTEPSIIIIKGHIYHSKGDFIKAEEEYKKLLDLDNPYANIEGKHGLCELYVVQGEFKKAEELAKQGIELAEKIGRISRFSERKTTWLFFKSLIYIYLRTGNLQEALELCKDLSEIPDLHLKGLIYINLKAIQEAEKTASELNEVIQKDLNNKLMRYYYNLMGMIELERENFPEALDYFKKALRLLSFPNIPNRSKLDYALFIEPIGLAYFKMGDLDKAKEEYEKITSLTAGRLYYGDRYVLSFYMLGKIYEAKSQKEKAIEHYDKFLDLWKHADLGITEVGDAKNRLASLKSQ